ncbi:MAG: hypothetical protein NVS2B17_25210 [Candidatus Velthaea sp.]
MIGDIMGFDPFRYPSPDLNAPEIHRSETGYHLEFPVAGYRPDDIHVTLEDRVLSIEGQTERRRFTRAIALPDDIDEDNIDAKVEYGMLTLSLRLHPKAQPRKISVRVSGGTEQGALENPDGGASTAPG